MSDDDDDNDPNANGRTIGVMLTVVAIIFILWMLFYFPPPFLEKG